MKINLITLHSIHNFGSVFQAMALEKFLEDHDNQVTMVDYRPSYNLAGRNVLRTWIAKALNLGAYVSRKKKFDTFISEHMNLSPRYKTHADLEKAFSAAEKDTVFLVGGDQLWNPYHYCGNDSAYRLSFAPEHSRKLAFGTSMGKSNFSQSELEPLSQDLREFRAVGVREPSSVGILEGTGLQNVKHVCDPVLLLDRSYYESILQKPEIPEKYILVYLVDQSELLDDCLEYMSRKTGCKIVHVCGFRKKCRCDYMIKNEGPDQVLGLVRNAEYVVSASFHATLFSLLFHKNFITLLPNQNTNARITELLGYVGLSGQIVCDKGALEDAVREIDFRESEEKLSKLVDFSKSFLLSELEKTELD